MSSSTLADTSFAKLRKKQTVKRKGKQNRTLSYTTRQHKKQLQQRRHRNCEKKRHHELNDMLLDLYAKIPGSDSVPNNTISEKLSDVIRYVAFLEQEAEDLVNEMKVTVNFPFRCLVFDEISKFDIQRKHYEGFEEFCASNPSKLIHRTIIDMESEPASLMLESAGCDKDTCTLCDRDTTALITPDDSEETCKSPRRDTTDKATQTDEDVKSHRGRGKRGRLMFIRSYNRSSRTKQK